MRQLNVFCKCKASCHLQKNCYLLDWKPFLKVMKNAFYFILKALCLSILRIFKFLVQLFGHVGKTAWSEKDRLNFKIHDVTVLKQLQYTYCQNLTKQRQPDNNLIWSVNRIYIYSNRNIFLQKLCRKWGRETSFFSKSLIWGESKWSAA